MMRSLPIWTDSLYQSVQMDKDLIIVMAANTEVGGAWQRLELERSTQELKKDSSFTPKGMGWGKRGVLMPSPSPILTRSK